MQASLDKFFPRLARRLVISHNIKPNGAVSVNARSGVINAITTNMPQKYSNLCFPGKRAERKTANSYVY